MAYDKKMIRPIIKQIKECRRLIDFYTRSGKDSSIRGFDDEADVAYENARYHNGQLQAYIFSLNCLVGASEWSEDDF